jgi:abelson tyrosine-protein kinase 1
MSRMACLWLPQCCVDILICIRQEVQDAGGDVGDELKEPVDKLVVCIFFLPACVPVQCS